MPGIYVTHENPLKFIMGLAGLSIDAIVNDYKTKLYVYELWKYDRQIKNFISKREDEVAKEKAKKEDLVLLKHWRKSLNENRYYRKKYVHNN